MKDKVYVGLTYGDPAGIGPEIVLKTLKNWKKYKFKFKPLVIGEKDCLGGNTNGADFHPGDGFQIRKKCYKLGYPSKLTGKHSYKCLKEGIRLAKEKKVFALVTGPVSKAAINSAKIKFSGQTEEIAKSCKTSPGKAIMLFVSSDFRVALFTRHIPLKKVSSEITKNKLKKYILLLNKELKKWFCLKSPRIAVLGLNPHASENGLFGNEEKKVISPVIKELSSCGLKIYGPFSPDGTLATAGQDYLKNKKQKYDVYVSFYHDQALPVFKAVAGTKGVNVTLGLPFLRVSVDHGTAFDIAGKNKADHRGLVSAVKFVSDFML